MDARARVWSRCTSMASLIPTLSIVESSVFAPATLSFRHMTVLVGMHGTGKSYLLRLLHELLPNWQAMIDDLPPVGPNSAVGMSGRFKLNVLGGELETVLEHDPNSRRQPARLVSDEVLGTYLSSLTVQHELWGYGDGYRFAEAVPEASFDLNRIDLEALAAITGHRYEWLRYETVLKEGSWFPRISGVRNGRSIDVWTMSASEFWVNYILWTLRAADKSEILLLDEPEGFLATPGHAAFIDEIARLSIRTGCQVVLATHSSEMIRRVPPECLQLMTSLGGPTTFSRVTNASSVLRALGRPDEGARRIYLVEDTLAGRMLASLLRAYSSEALDQAEIVPAGGTGEVLAGVRALRQSQRISVRGVLDGDQLDRPNMPEGVHVLPGGHPETDLLAALHADTKGAASTLGVAEEELRLALDASKFSHHQAVFSRLARQLPSVSEERVLETALECWINEPSIKAAASDWVLELVR